MASAFDSYAVLGRQNVEVLPLLKFHFKEVFKTIHRRLSIRPTLKNPWVIVVSHKIFFDVFIQFFRAVRDYKIQLGVEIIEEKRDRHRRLLSAKIKFSNYNTFLFHFDKALGGGIEIKSLLQKSIRDCTAKVVISDDKPALLNYDCKKHLLNLKVHYLAKNRYGNIL